MCALPENFPRFLNVVLLVKYPGCHHASMTQRSTRGEVVQEQMLRAGCAAATHALRRPGWSQVSRLSTASGALNPMLDAATRMPKRIAVTEDASAVTYGALFVRSMAVAEQLREAVRWEPASWERGCLAGAPGADDVVAGPRVAILADRSEHVAAQWGAWLAGCAAVPLCTSHPPAELAYALGAARCDAVVLPPRSSKQHAEYARLAAAALDALPASARPRIVVQEREHPAADLEPGLTSALREAAGQLMPSWADMPSSKLGSLILFTSGTTSRPKGVLHTHASLGDMTATLRQAWAWSSDDTVLHTLPMHHLHGVVNVAACAQASGAEIQWERKFDPASVWARLLGTAAPSVFMGVPTMYARMLQHLASMSLADQRAAKGLGSKMRLMVSGSAPLPQGLAAAWQAATGMSLLERYGMTELGMALSNGLDVRDREFGTVGRPLPGVECRIAVPLLGRQRDEGSNGAKGGSPPVGELWVRGGMVSPGYWERPEANAEAFVPASLASSVVSDLWEAPGNAMATADAAAQAARPWFRTGDVATVRESSGRWQLLGRESVDIIKSAGFKVSALEVEAAVLDCPGVAEVAVLGMDDAADMGELITAVVVPETGSAAPTLDAIREQCKSVIAQYKLPRALIVVAQIERNAMGKVNKKELRKQLQSPPAGA